MLNEVGRGAAPGAEPALKPVSMVPDQVQFDCPTCSVTHILFRGLDYDEDPAGVWRCVEAGGLVGSFECDCGVLLDVAFTLNPLPAPSQESK